MTTTQVLALGSGDVLATVWPLAVVALGIAISLAKRALT